MSEKVPMSLTAGDRLSAVTMQPEPNGMWDHRIRVGKGGVVSITVVLEGGQMGYVPWAEVKEENDGKTALWRINLAHAVCVDLEQAQ